MIGVGIIGCGLIGTKRAYALGKLSKLVACADLDIDKAIKLAGENAYACKDWRELLVMPSVNMVIIATLHDSLAEITLEAIKAGKHVLVEKPAAKCANEIKILLEETNKSSVKIHVGFNHRYHKAMIKAKEIIDSALLGELMFIRGRYGHGGRLGYDREWRSNPKQSGGGELKDQGPHLIDLARWYFGKEFKSVEGFANTFYWDMPVDDNGFMLLRTNDNQTAFLHASCTEWKNLFSLEIYGKNGKIEINGLGGSYGTESITWYKMLPEMGPPETYKWEYPMADKSWELEINEFCQNIIEDTVPECSLNDAYASLKIIDKIYKDSGYDHCS